MLHISLTEIHLCVNFVENEISRPILNIPRFLTPFADQTLCVYAVNASHDDDGVNELNK